MILIVGKKVRLLMEQELVKRQPVVVVSRCNKCNSCNNYYRVRSKSFVCRRCGNVFSLAVSAKQKGV